MERRSGTIQLAMRSALPVLVVLALLTGAVVAQKRRDPKAKQGPKLPEVAVVKIQVQREPKIVAIEGIVRNDGEQPLRGLTLFFVFLEGDGHTITRKKIAVSGGTLQPGEEGEFLAQTVDPVRAVQIKLEAEDKDGRFLNVDKPGPYDIE
jgi:hypothetical protein